jgi:hypothetical protein
MCCAPRNICLRDGRGNYSWLEGDVEGAKWHVTLDLHYLVKGGLRELAKPIHDHGETLNYNGLK